MIPRKNALEWTVFAVSLAIVIAAVTVLLLSASRAGDQPPDFAITIGQPTRHSSGYRVPVTIQNRGDRTAADLTIEVTLENGGTVVERSEFTLPFLPRKSRREGAALFEQDPRCCRIMARAVGYEQP